MTDAELKAVRAVHWSDQWSVPRCVRCHQTWPCDTVQVLEAVSEVRAAWLRARVGETDAWTLLDKLLGVQTDDEAEREAAVQA